MVGFPTANTTRGIEPIIGKNAFCLTKGLDAFVSWDIGDLADYKHYTFYLESTKKLSDLLKISPVVVAHDLHPDYVSTRYAKQLGLKKLVAVQHHHAHMAACMTEHGLTETVIGVTFDGLGLGSDGTLWGGEFLIGDLKDFKRAAHFKQYPMPGGDQATLYPERMAFSCMLSETDNAEQIASNLLPGLDTDTQIAIRSMIANEVRSPLTSSAGRLFDSISAMLGFRGRISSPGEAAIQLQQKALPGIDGVYAFTFEDSVLSFGPMIKEIVADLENNVAKGSISAKFHNTLALATATACEAIRAQDGPNGIVLSGGVFHNRLLHELIVKRLQRKGFEVYSHLLLPPGDISLSLGQAAVARARNQAD